MMEIVSVFTVKEYKTEKQYVEYPLGDGQDAIRNLRKDYPRFTKFILEGFEIDGTFYPLTLHRYNRL